jgi:ComF family protein
MQVFNFQKLKKQILDILFPWKCLICYNYTDKNWPLCDECWNKIHKEKYFVCPICQKRINPNNFKYCHTNTNILGYATPLDFSLPEIKQLVHYFKYQGITDLKERLAKFMLIPLLEYKNIFLYNDWILIPVPLHKLKERKRGFNQSKLLAKEIIKYFPLEYSDQVLIKIKNNPSQAKLKNKVQRFKNSENIFTLNNEFINIIKNKNIILIDDVYTTGATINAAANILKQNGAKNIVALCLAKEKF